MSDLAKSFAKTRLSAQNHTPPRPRPPPVPLFSTPESSDTPEPFPDSDQDFSSDSSVSSTGTIRPPSSQRLSSFTVTTVNSGNSGLPWTSFFEQELYLETKLPLAQSPDQTGAGTGSRAKYHVYLTLPSTSTSPLFVLHHGAGSSGLSFASFGVELRRLYPNAGLLAIDARDHGSVVWDENGEVVSDFSIDALSNDLNVMVRLVWERIAPTLPTAAATTSQTGSMPKLPPILLVGHSLGGAVCVDVAYKSLLGPSLLGYAVLDVVEGSAIEALQFMQSYIVSRPPRFPTVEKAVDWHVRSRTIRNLESARVSVPGLLRRDLRNDGDGEGQQDEIMVDDANGGLESVTEEDEDEETGSLPVAATKGWTWKTDLRTTQPYWQGWFEGMSKKFLDAKGAKLLLLAGTDRLDRELMIGQMQGKFQLQVFPTAGHFIHEDLPDRTAEVISEFFRRNDRSAIVLPPKVSDLLKQGKKV